MRRPINPVIPYPHEAIQHTRCVLALSMITVAISFLKPETLALLGDLGRQVEKVDRWIERCSDDVQRRLSAGAKRDLDRRFHILAEHVDSALAESGSRRGHSGGFRRRFPLDAMGCRNVGRAHLPRRRPEHLPRLLPGPSLAQPAQDADHAVQCARKGRPADSRNRDAGV